LRPTWGRNAIQKRRDALGAVARAWGCGLARNCSSRFERDRQSIRAIAFKGCRPFFVSRTAITIFSRTSSSASSRISFSCALGSGHARDRESVPSAASPPTRAPAVLRLEGLSRLQPPSPCANQTAGSPRSGTGATVEMLARLSPKLASSSTTTAAASAQADRFVDAPVALPDGTEHEPKGNYWDNAVAESFFATRLCFRIARETRRATQSSNTSGSSATTPLCVARDRVRSEVRARSVTVWRWRGGWDGKWRGAAALATRATGDALFTGVPASQGLAFRARAIASAR